MKRASVLLGLALLLLVACSSSSSDAPQASRNFVTGDHKCTQSSPGANIKCDDGQIFPQLCGNSRPPCWSLGAAADDGSLMGVCADCCVPGTASPCEPIQCHTAADCPFGSSQCVAGDKGSFCSAN